MKKKSITNDLICDVFDNDKTEHTSNIFFQVFESCDLKWMKRNNEMVLGNEEEARSFSDLLTSQWLGANDVN